MQYIWKITQYNANEILHNTTENYTIQIKIMQLFVFNVSYFSIKAFLEINLNIQGLDV